MNDPRQGFCAESFTRGCNAKSDELFDWLVLLDVMMSRQTSSYEVLSRTAPVFPSGVDIIIHNELRSFEPNRSASGLESLCELGRGCMRSYHELFLETDAELRLKGVT